MYIREHRVCILKSKAESRGVYQRSECSKRGRQRTIREQCLESLRYVGNAHGADELILSGQYSVCPLTCHSHKEIVPCVHTMKWWSLEAPVPQLHPLTVVISNCVIPHQYFLESYKISLFLCLCGKHHSTIKLSLELGPDLDCEVLQNLHLLRFFAPIEFTNFTLYCSLKNPFSPFYMG